MSDDHCVIKLDFRNAFNSLHRDAMLDAVYTNAPGIYKFCYASYNKASILAFNDRTTLSQEGTQQGDPLGALLFCIALQPILLDLNTELVFGYMDDVTIGRLKRHSTGIVNFIRTRCEKIWLTLTDSKCEIITTSGTCKEPMFKDYVQLTPHTASLLGALLLTGTTMDMMLQEKCDDIACATNRLKLIPSHDALTLLKGSLCAPKLQHILRSSPCADNHLLDVFDGHLMQGISQITNTDLTFTQRMQASLPIKMGGLGIRRVASLASSAFLASAAGTRNLQDRILFKAQAPHDHQHDQVLAGWI